MSKKNGTPRKRRRRSFGQVFRRPQGHGWLARYPDPDRRLPGGRTRYVTRSVASKAEGEALLKEVRKAILLGRYAPAEPEAAGCDLSLLQAIDEFIEAKHAEGRSANGIRRYMTSRAAIAQSPLAGHRVADIAAGRSDRY